MNGRFRRILLLATHPGEGRFTQPTAAVQTWRPELVFMPHFRHSPPPPGTAQVGGFLPFRRGGVAQRKPRFADTMSQRRPRRSLPKRRKPEIHHRLISPFRLSDPTSFELSREYHCAFGPIVSASEGTVHHSSGTELLAFSPFALETPARSRTREPAHRVFTAPRRARVAGCGRGERPDRYLLTR